MKNHQLIAVVEGKKKRSSDILTAFYQDFQKESGHASLNGLTRKYTSYDAESKDQPPDEKKMPQKSVLTSVNPVLESLADAIDSIAGMDATNCLAKADIEVDGQKLVTQVPVTTLLYLEKRMVDVRTVISKLPTLDPAEIWAYDPVSSSYRSEPSQAQRTKKVVKNHVKYEATENHPAQVDTFTEDVPVGTWTTTKFSGAIPMTVKKVMEENITKLIEAIKIAREVANQQEGEIKNGTGNQLLDFVFAPLKKSVG